MSTSLPLVIIFVRRFERCLQFYQKVFGLKLLRTYKGAEHPPWAEFRLGASRLALHGNYKGAPYRRGPVVIHFAVKDIWRTVKRIRRYGGSIKVPPKKYDFRPAELVIAYEGSFADPDGNLFDIQQVLKKFSK